MNRPLFGWALAVAALGVGYLGYGWPGVALACTAIVFWLLLQFSRAMRVMRQAGRAPIGQVDSAVMLHARLRTGMTMSEVLPLAGSLGQAVGAPDDETFRWRDAGGVAVEVRFARGRVDSWRVERPEDAAAPPTP